jgi:hypothetical protein
VVFFSMLATQQGQIMQWDRQNHHWIVELGRKEVTVTPSELTFNPLRRTTFT